MQREDMQKHASEEVAVEIGPPIDLEAEKRLVRKVDKYVVPMVMIAYLLCFLDRTNIGNARLFGLEEDLGLVGNQYQIAVAALFATYVLVEVPSNLILKRFRPSRWIAFITVCWGIVSTMTGVVQNFAGLVTLRLLLGLFEGGLLPGLTMYLTFFYTRNEIALRIGYLFVSSALSGACGGMLAYGISFMDGVGGQSGWRWIFILEGNVDLKPVIPSMQVVADFNIGIPTVVFGVAVWWMLADGPETAWYLTTEERRMLVARLNRQVGFNAEFDKKDAILAVKDWKTWFFALGQFGVNAMLYSYSIFLPTIIRGMVFISRSTIDQRLTCTYRTRKMVFYPSTGTYCPLLRPGRHFISTGGETVRRSAASRSLSDHLRLYLHHWVRYFPRRRAL